MTTTTFPLTGSVSLLARIGHGSLTVTAQDDLSEARVTLTPRETGSSLLDRAVVELRGSVLVVAMPRQGGIFDLPIFGARGRSKDAIDIEVTLPSGSAVKVSSFTADLTMVGRVGAANLAFGTSTVALDTVEGNLSLRFGSGSAEVERVRGDAHVRSGAGSVRIGEVGGALTSGCGSGDLNIGRANGTVRSRTGSGSASLGAVYGDVDLASGSGAMTIGLPSGITARLDVVSGSGDVGTDLPVDKEPAAKRRPITVRARTGSGPVRIVSAA